LLRLYTVLFQIEHMDNISHLVWLYVKRRPFLKEVLQEGIVNYSALARKMSIEAFGGEHENAIKMALIRLSRKMEKVDTSLEQRILETLHKSSMVVKSKVAVILTNRKIEEIKPLSFTQSGNHMTYIVEQRELDRMDKKPPRIEEDLNLFIIESPEDVEEVPGVISYILGALASEGINVVEFISCHRDTLLVLKQQDTQKAYQILSSIME
jgi:hypothetical protein